MGARPQSFQDPHPHPRPPLCPAAPERCISEGGKEGGMWVGGAVMGSRGALGEGAYPLPRGGGQPGEARSPPALLPAAAGQGTGFPFWGIMGYPALGLSLRGPSPPWLWRGALTADLGTAAAVGGRPLLLESTASVSVCSILRGPERVRGRQECPFPRLQSWLHALLAPPAPALSSPPSPHPCTPLSFCRPLRPTPCSCGH